MIVRSMLIATSLASLLAACSSLGVSSLQRPAAASRSAQDAAATATPIKHLVVIYGENVSFDHYFGSYPQASNPAGEPPFTAAANTPSVNGLSAALLTRNPNYTNAANGAGAANPFRLDRSQAATADQDHGYTQEQLAYDNGVMDLFPKYTGSAGSGGAGAFNTKGLVMGYYDGNTVTALWNYAQHFAMSDNAYSDQFGPSTPGALSLVSGQTNGMKVGVNIANSTSFYINDGQGERTMISDVDPAGDICSSASKTATMTGRNVGDLLNGGKVTWGWFEGGFNTAVVNPNGTTGCSRSTYSDITRAAMIDYIPHHQPFQYYASTANLQHLRPSSTAAIGYALQADGKTPDPANHQYGMQDFFTAVKGGNFPSVAFLKASGYQDGHAGYSNPLDEQAFVVKVLNFLQQQPDWRNTAVIVAYDDSDGWYDHLMAKIGNGSFDAVADQITSPGNCGIVGLTPVLGGVSSSSPVNGRCGPGTRQPFLVISPWAKANAVDSTLITQSSVMRFIEDNWLNGQRVGDGSFDAGAGSIMGLFDFAGGGKNPALYLDPVYGTPLTVPPQS